jgi:hypothetical protein
MSDIVARTDPGVDMLIFWEKGRIMYNAVLLVIVMPYLEMLIALWPAFLSLAIAANALYCIAYPVDLLMQHTTFTESWMRRGRWLLLLLGTVIAAGLAASVMFGPAGDVPGTAGLGHGARFPRRRARSPGAGFLASGHRRRALFALRHRRLPRNRRRLHL